MFTDLSYILNIIQTLAIVITLLVVAWQTKELVRQTRLNTIVNLNSHLKEINQLLIQDKELVHSGVTSSMIKPARCKST